MNMLERARTTLREAIRAGEGDATREGIMKRIEQTEALRDETMNLAAKCPEPGVRELMERARERLRLAREHAENGRLETAAAEISVARNMYQRIGELCAR
jgi:phage terminase Nu1 subunit (DNA packaging protein)